MDNESRRLFILVPLGLGLIGGLFFVLGLIRFRRERAFARGAVGATGIVIGFERRRSTTRTGGSRVSRYLDFPVVRYTTREGREIQFESPVGTSPRLQREGQPVQVLYDPANPGDARLASGCMRYGLPLAFTLLGLGMMAFSALFGLVAWFVVRQLPAA